MNSLKVLKTLTVGKGQIMEINVDESQPEDSIDRYATTTISTGEAAFEVPPHWHKHHQEYLSVLEGRLLVTVDGKSALVKAGDPALLVPRRAVHSMKGFKGERMILREVADPAGLYKALFFNDVLSQGGFVGIWHILRAFYDGDAYLSLPLRSQIVDEAFLLVFGGIAKLFVSKKPETL